MESYCVNYKTNTAIEKACIRKTKQNILMLLSNCVACGKKKIYFY